MPIYEFVCKKCNKKYETITSYDETEKYKGVKCPECNSKKKSKLVSACRHAFTNPVGTDRWNSDSGGHGYRFDYNLPNVINERKNAEINSHMGQDPYGEADLSKNDIELDTGIHDAEEKPTMLTDYPSR